MSLLTKDSKPAWKAQLPEWSWSNSWNKTNKNNYRAICEDVKTSTNTQTLTNSDMNLERVVQPAFKMMKKEGTCCLIATSWVVFRSS